VLLSKKKLWGEELDRIGSGYRAETGDGENVNEISASLKIRNFFTNSGSMSFSSVNRLHDVNDGHVNI
jgi:hypothetical protein